MFPIWSFESERESFSQLLLDIIPYSLSPFSLTENLSIYFQNSTEKNYKTEILYGVYIKAFFSNQTNIQLFGKYFVFYVGRQF